MTSIKASRGDIWLVDLNPTRGHEQAGKRPCLVVSVDLFNQGASGESGCFTNYFQSAVSLTLNLPLPVIDDIDLTISKEAA